MSRVGEKRRTTRETDVRVRIDLDGKGLSKISSGIGFLDHMLELFARHGLFDLEVSCSGDLHIDAHHSVEDIAITLGQSVAEALGNKEGIVRFGAAYVPMDEALVRAVIDLSGRAFTVYKVNNVRERIGELDVELVQHFWRSFAGEVHCNIHIELLYGANQHHITEGIFKAAARALSAATRTSDRVEGVLSTKGSL
jgi:imidazoleglycerol-phosphate dehydratase